MLAILSESRASNLKVGRLLLKAMEENSPRCKYHAVKSQPFANALRTTRSTFIDFSNPKSSIQRFMHLEGIDHIAMGVRDIERSAEWYIEVLGFERLHEGMWNGVPTFIGRGNTGIALFPATHEPQPSAHREIRMLHLAFRADGENFMAAQRELHKRGIKFEFQDHEIARSIYFRDPDGHQLEITTYEVIADRGNEKP